MIQEIFVLWNNLESTYFLPFTLFNKPVVLGCAKSIIYCCAFSTAIEYTHRCTKTHTWLRQKDCERFYFWTGQRRMEICFTASLLAWSSKLRASYLYIEAEVSSVWVSEGRCDWLPHIFQQTCTLWWAQLKKPCQVFRLQTLRGPFFTACQYSTHMDWWCGVCALQQIRQAATHWKPVGLAISQDCHPDPLMFC